MTTTEDGERPCLVDMTEVAERMGLGVQTVRDLHRRGELPVPVIRLGRRLKVRSVDLDKYLIGAAA